MSILADEDDDDPFSCFGSDDEDSAEGVGDTPSEEVNASTSASISRARRLVDETNARLEDGSSRRTSRPATHAAASVELLPLISPDFEVFNSPDKGKGLRALRPYARGDEILRELAVMRVPNSQAASSREEAQLRHASAVRKAFDDLHPATREAVLDLSSCDQWLDADGGIVTPLGVFQTNSYRLGGGGSGTDDDDGAVFLTLARVNHSCRPNACHFWRPDLQQMIVVASRDIRANDEVFSSYGPSECLDTAGRRAYLSEHFSFDCACEMCTEGNANGGDDRMVELNALQKDISLLSPSDDPIAAKSSIDHCLELFEEQGIGSGAFVKPILHCGYQVALTGLRDEAMARSYLARELAAVKECEGVGSPHAGEIQRELDRMVT